MIVRNESAILERCLRSVAPHISAYVICDTGSTDDTVALIERVLGEAGVPGEVCHIPFENFEQARNASLERCRTSGLAFDTILLIDADMELVVERPDWRDDLHDRAWLVRQVSGGSFSYYNMRLIPRAAQASYVGLTHEYLAVEAPKERLEGVFMIDHACGSSRGVKLERDEKLLSQALAANPLDARAAFYLGNTLREAGRYDDALRAYTYRISLGGWDEEVWYAAFMLARCYEALGNTPRFVAACLEAYNLRPSRAESLHALADHYRKHGLHEASILLCEQGLRIPLTQDVLFVDEAVYKTGFRSIYSISGFYCQAPERRATARRFCAELMVEAACPRHTRDLARSNWRYYARGVEQLLSQVRFLRLEIERPSGYQLSSPSLALRSGEGRFQTADSPSPTALPDISCVVRTVNYRLVDGRYHVDDNAPISTLNFLTRLDESLAVTACVPIHDPEPGPFQDAPIRGLEDVRIVEYGRQLRACCTVADRSPDWKRQLATFDLDDDGTVHGLTLQTYQDHLHQKNWMPWVDEEGPGFVYSVDPTVILRQNPATHQCHEVARHSLPLALEHQRGGSGLVPFDEGWLAITHEVAWQGHARTYLHRFVHFDAAFRPRAVSEPFWFRQSGIEFCCGLVVGPARGLKEDEFLASFSVNDGEAWLMVAGLADVRRQLVEIVYPA